MQNKKPKENYRKRNIRKESANETKKGKIRGNWFVLRGVHIDRCLSGPTSPSQKKQKKGGRGIHFHVTPS